MRRAWGTRATRLSCCLDWHHVQVICYDVETLPDTTGQTTVGRTVQVVGNVIYLIFLREHGISLCCKMDCLFHLLQGCQSDSHVSMPSLSDSDVTLPQVTLLVLLSKKKCLVAGNR